MGGDATLVLIDVATGNEVGRIPVGDDPIPDRSTGRRERADGAFVSSTGYGYGSTGVEVLLPDGSVQTILSATEAPDSYYFDQVQWSPDGAWVLVSDTAGRLLVAGADGTPDARTVAEGLDGWGSQAAWYIPGNSMYTVEMPKN